MSYTDFEIPVLKERSIEELPPVKRIYCRHKQFMKTVEPVQAGAWTHDSDDMILKLVGIVEKYYLDVCTLDRVDDIIREKTLRIRNKLKELLAEMPADNADCENAKILRWHAERYRKLLNKLYFPTFFWD
jgi:hypothetical protein